MKPTKICHNQKIDNKKYQILKNNSSLTLDTILSFLIFSIMIVILSKPKYFSNATISGLKLFIFSVLPGLFPFMFLTKLLTEIGLIFKLTNKLDKFSNKVFGTPGISMFAFFMSILSGYPIGAKIISDLFEKGLITQKYAKKMSVFCTTSGPIFVIGAVGEAMFGNMKIGIIIYISHILSSIILGITLNLLTFRHVSQESCQKNIIHFQKENNIFSECVNKTINSIFVVGAYITIFYLISEICTILKITDFLTETIYILFKNFNFSKSQCNSLIYGIIEVTRGCKELSLIASNSSICLCSAIISFSGVSIIMQELAFFKNCKIKMHQFVFTKLIHSLLSFCICALIIIFIL